MFIIGLDISTTATAYCILYKENNKINLLEADSINVSEKDNLYDKAILVREKFEILSKKYKFDKISVEESLQSFRPGFSSAKTLSTLSKFNGIVCYLAQDIFCKNISFANVIHVRSFLGIKISKKDNVSSKERVFEYILARKEFKDFSWPKKILKNGKRKGEEVYETFCYDIADASMMSLFAAISID